MPIIKQQKTEPLIRDAVVLDLGDLGRQAARLKAAAQARAEQILQEARDEAQRLIDAAEQTGYEAGHAKGLAQGQEEGQAQGHAEALAAGAQQVQQATAQFEAVAQEWESQRTTFDREARSAVLAFALKFARRVTHRVIETDPAVVTDQVAAALGRVLEPTDVTIRVHPEDRATLTETLPDLLAGLSHLQQVELLDDQAVGRGGCALALRGGEVDASIDTQIRRIVEVMLPGTPQEAAPEDAREEPTATSEAHEKSDEETPPPAEK